MRISDWSSDVCSSDLAESYGSINDLRAAVSADLEQLLNTRSEGARLIPGVFEECRSSLLTYGISDYSSLSLLSPHDRDGIRRSLERAIALHEKRLTRVRVALQQQRPYERALRFHVRSEEHTSELQSLIRISYAVFCLKKKRQTTTS